MPFCYGNGNAWETTNGIKGGAENLVGTSWGGCRALGTTSGATVNVRTSALTVSAAGGRAAAWPPGRGGSKVSAKPGSQVPFVVCFDATELE